MGGEVNPLHQVLSHVTSCGLQYSGENIIIFTEEQCRGPQILSIAVRRRFVGLDFTRFQSLRLSARSPSKASYKKLVFGEFSDPLLCVFKTEITYMGGLTPAGSEAAVS